MANKRIFDINTIASIEDIDEHTWIWIDKKAPEGEPALPAWRVRGDIFLKVLNNFATHFVPNVLTVVGKCYWYGGDLYECNTAYSGAWVPANFTATSIDELFARKDVLSELQTDVGNLQDALGTTNGNVTTLTTYAQNVAHSIAPEYDGTTGAVAGKLYMHEGKLYRCKENTSGNWVANKFTEVPVSDYLLRTILSLNTSSSANVTDANNAPVNSIVFCYANNNVGNLPVPTSGNLITVSGLLSGSNPYQMYVDTAGKFYMRAKVSAWTSWKEVAFSDDVASVYATIASLGTTNQSVATINNFLNSKKYFSEKDYADYKALFRFKNITFSANEITKPITSVRVSQVYKDGNDVVVILNVNDNVSSNIYSQDIILRYPIASGMTTVTGTKGVVASHFYGLSWSVTFDATDYSTSENISLSATGSRALYFGTDILKEQLHYEKSLNNIYDQMNGVKNYANKSNYVGMDLVTLLSKSYFRNILNLDARYDGDLWLTLMSYNSGTGAFQFIFNKDKSNNGTNYTQSIVINATASEGFVSGHYSSNGVIVDYAVNVSATFSFNEQKVSTGSPVLIIQRKEPLEFDSVADFSESPLVEGIVGTTRLRKAPSGAVINLTDSRTIMSEKLVIEKDFTSYDSDSYFMGVDLDGKLLFCNTSNGKIFRSTSYDSERELLIDMRAVDAQFFRTKRAYPLNNGNLLIDEDTDGEHIGGYWLINRSVTPFTAQKVFTFRNKYMTTARYGWDVFVDDNIIIIGEYGNSPVESGIGTKADATCVYRSLNYGRTWALMYNFKNLPNAEILPQHMHIHSVTYDRIAKRVWVCTGDNIDADGNCNNRINWSDDFGAHWLSKSLYKYFGNSLTSWDNPKCLSMYAAGDFLLFGGDDYHNSIFRAVRKNDTVKIEPVFRYLPEYTDRVTQFTGKFMRLDCGLIVVNITAGDSKPSNQRILGTFDGITWFTLFETEYTPVGSTALVSPNPGILAEYDGKLYFQCSEVDENDVVTRHFYVFRSPKLY